MFEIASYITVAGILMVASILLGRTSNRIGVPALLAFVGLGMLAGAQGIGKIGFENYRLSFNLGTLALVVILFDGGFNTPVERVREAIVPAAILATVGVALTAAITGLAGLWFAFSWTQSLLLGFILSSTDAAAVFLIIRSAGIQLKRRPGTIVELESGLNDPMAFLMTVALTRSLVAHHTIDFRTLIGVPISLTVGGCAGIAIGWSARLLLRRMHLGAGGLYPVFTLAVALLSFGLPALAGGSGLLAVYVAGIVMGAGHIPHLGGIRRFHDSLAWLAQLSMFMLLGLLVTPSELWKVAIPGLTVALMLTLVARPIAVLVCLLPFGLTAPQLSYIAAVGLRGAVPIILAIYPIMFQAPGAQRIFNLAFFGVIANALLPGAMVGWLAARLGVASEEPPAPPAVLEIASGEILEGGEILSFRVEAFCAVAGAAVSDLPLPAGSSVVLMIRGREIIAVQPDTTLVAGDHVYLLCAPGDQRFVSLLFGHHEVD